jgi:hypothetical protein
MQEICNDVIILFSLLIMLLLPYLPLLVWVLCDKYGLLD